jgi:hypothetical protein
MPRNKIYLVIIMLSYSSGDIPLDINIRETSDNGKPVVVSNPDGPQVIDID